MTQKDKEFVLFVCTGNTCRSPMAQGFFNEEASKRGLSLCAKSAGISALANASATMESQVALSEKGVDISAHRAQSITPALIEEAKVIFAMTRAHADFLQGAYPHCAQKIEVFANKDVADPYGGDAERYKRAAAEIFAGVALILERPGEKT